MKRNVDLSENRMFTTPEEPTGLIKLFLDSIKVTKPWDFEHNPRGMDEIFSKKGRRLFGVGNKKDRQNWKLGQEYAVDKICDCCGQNRGKKPWARIRCNCYSMKYTPKIPWKF